jgi:hypothetical protein
MKTTIRCRRQVDGTIFRASSTLPVAFLHCFPSFFVVVTLLGSKEDRGVDGLFVSFCRLSSYPALFR